MKNMKGLQKTLMASTVIVVALGAAPAKAVTSNQDFGHCVGAQPGNDCVTTNGHISASVVGTLSINEMRAVSFGNFAVTCTGACSGGATLVLSPTGVRTATAGGGDAIVLLHGANATGGSAGGAGSLETGSQSPGHYTVSASVEAAATTQVYISFADNLGNIIDACSPNGSTGGAYGGTWSPTPGTCDNYHPGAKVTLNGPAGNAFTVDSFVFNESGSDVYGHYINNQAAVGPGIAAPFLPNAAGGGTNGHAATGAPGNANATQAIDVVVGGTLHTVAAILPTPGKYTSSYDVMVSY